MLACRTHTLLHLWRTHSASHNSAEHCGAAVPAAVGPSLEMGASAQAAQAQEQQEESGVEGWAQKQLGLTPDQWQRYMVGFHQDEAEARKAAVATKVCAAPGGA